MNERELGQQLTASNTALTAQRAKAAQVSKRRELELEVQQLRSQLEVSSSGTSSGASSKATDELKRQHILGIAEIKK